jgi:hypothetical protein
VALIFPVGDNKGMLPSIRIPSRIVAGSTTTCRLCGFSPQEGWALSLALRGEGDPVDVEGTADGDAFLVEIPAALTAGKWWWQVKVTDGTNTHLPAAGELLVEPNLFDQGGSYDGRSEARIALDAIDAVLANKATADQQAYTIKGRSLTRYAVADLLKLRSFFAAKIRKERGHSGFRSRGVRF